jgi:hypothetical protein
MNMPGFTAEASTYKTRGHYGRRAGRTGAADMQMGLAQVIPAFPLCRPFTSKCLLYPGLGCFIEKQYADCSGRLIPCKCPLHPVLG